MGELETRRLCQGFREEGGFGGRSSDCPPQVRRLRSMMVLMST